MRKNILASSKRLKRKRFILKLAVFFVCFACVAAGAACFFRISKFRIQKILIKGNLTVETKELAAAVSESLSGNYYFFLPKNNIFIFSKREIEAEILANFSKVESVSVKSDFPGAVSVEIKERETAGLLCAESDCVFVDSRGFAFQGAPYFSGNVYLKFTDERAGPESPAGGRKSGFQLLPEEPFSKLVEFCGYLAREKINVREIILKKEGNYELRAEEGWKILLNEKNEPQTAFENFKIALDSEIKEKISELEYIDVRFGNKVFYKFK